VGSGWGRLEARYRDGAQTRRGTLLKCIDPSCFTEFPLSVGNFGYFSWVFLVFFSSSDIQETRAETEVFSVGLGSSG